MTESEKSAAPKNAEKPSIGRIVHYRTNARTREVEEHYDANNEVCVRKGDIHVREKDGGAPKAPVLTRGKAVTDEPATIGAFITKVDGDTVSLALIAPDRDRIVHKHGVSRDDTGQADKSWRFPPRV